MKNTHTSLAIILFFILSSCSAPKPENMDSIVMNHIVNEPDNLHPTNGLSSLRTELFTYSQIYLITVNPENNEIMPWLAESLPVFNETTNEFAFKLRKDITWDNGDTVTANDVLFTFKVNKNKLTNNTHAKPFLDNIINIDVINNHEMKIKVKKKQVINLYIFSDYNILQEKFYDSAKVFKSITLQDIDSPDFNETKYPLLKKWSDVFNGQDYSYNPAYFNGAGPYKIVAWQRDQFIRLEKKKNHWTKDTTKFFECAFPQQLVFKLNKSVNSYSSEIEKQGFDISNNIDYRFFKLLQAKESFNTNYYSDIIDTYNYSYIGMNMKPNGTTHPYFFDNLDVRKAIALATPVDDLNKILNNSTSKRITTPVAPMKKEHNGALPLISYDLKKAKQLLEQAGWKDTDNDNILDKQINGQKINFEFDFNYLTISDFYKDAAVIIADSYKKIGIIATLKPYDLPTFYEKASQHDFDMILAAWTGANTPDDFSQVWKSTEWANNGSNFVGFGNKFYDQIIDSINTTINENDHSFLVKKMQEIIYEEQPYVFLFLQTKRIICHKKYIKPVFHNSTPAILLNKLRLKSK